jgi:hypothetical protein
MKRTGFLLALAAACFAAPAAAPAQTPQIASARTDTIATLLGCSARYVAPNTKAVCALDARVKSDLATIAAAKATPAPQPTPVTPAPATTPTPTPAPVAPTPAPSSSSVLAAANFDDGTFGQVAPGSGAIDIVADPTSRATGKVLRIHYANNPSAGNVDANLGVWPNGVPSIGLGDSLWFAGDFYVDNTLDAMRKLTYWSNGAGVQFITTLQPGFGPDSNQFYMDVEGAQSRSTYTTFVRTRAWHHFVVSMRVNSSTSAADGLARAWIDGTLVATMTGVQWISSSGCAFNSWGVGYQAQASYAISEYRYWDNVIYSKSPLN